MVVEKNEKLSTAHGKQVSFRVKANHVGHASLNPWDTSQETEFWGTGDGFKPDKIYRGRKKVPRTDIEIKQQIREARELQKLLSEALDRFEICSRAAERVHVASEILNLYTKTKHILLVVQTLHNINNELLYCKYKINKARDEKTHQSLLTRAKWLAGNIHRLVEENQIDKLDNKLQLKTLKKYKPRPSQRNRQQIRREASPGSSFLTEAPYSRSIVSRSSWNDDGFAVDFQPSKKSVKLISPLISEQEDDSKLPMAEQYWNSDHHRVAYTPNKDVLLQEIPQSLHKIGLEVQDSFVMEDVDRDGTVPWLVEQNPEKGDYDIFRKDLERILLRVHKMQDKVKEAANLSVDKNLIFDRRASIRQSRDSMRSNTSKRSIHGIGDDSDEESIHLERRPLHERTREIEILPITRIDMSKSYPHMSDRWTEAHPKPNQVLPVETNVNQRDLKNKTKLRLFVLKRQIKKPKIKRDLVTPSSVKSTRSFYHVPPVAQFIENITGSEDGEQLSFFQKERLNDLLSNSLQSTRVADRLMACRSLATLGLAAVGEVAPILTASATSDKSSVIRFEASKAIMSLGQWPDVVFNELATNLYNSNDAVKADILQQLYMVPTARNLCLSKMENDAFKTLLMELQRLSTSKAIDSHVKYLAAVCLGMLCATHDEDSATIASTVLENVVLTTEIPEERAQALEVLVRQLGYCNIEIFKKIISQLQKAIKWNDRLAAALLIGYMGANQIFELMDEVELVTILRQKLWDDSKREVRLAVSQTFSSLGLRNLIMDTLEQDLRDKSEEVRSHAVISFSATGIRNDTTLRFLVEMLGLDASDYVRLQLMRTFHALQLTDIRVIRALRERERCGGRLAKAAARIMTAMDIPLLSSQTKKRNHDKTVTAMSSPMQRLTTGGASSWMTTPSRRASTHENILSRNQQYSSLNPDDISVRESRRTSMTSLSGKNLSRNKGHIEILSTSVRKSPFRRADSSRLSTYGEGRLLATASSFL